MQPLMNNADIRVGRSIGQDTDGNYYSFVVLTIPNKENEEEVITLVMPVDTGARVGHEMVEAAEGARYQHAILTVMMEAGKTFDECIPFIDAIITEVGHAQFEKIVHEGEIGKFFNGQPNS